MKEVRKYKGSPDHMITSIKENKMNASKKLYFSISNSVHDQNDYPKKDSVQKPRRWYCQLVRRVLIVRVAWHGIKDLGV